MNELTDQLITLFSSILITVMFLAVAVNIFRRNHAPDTRHPLKWRIPVGHLDMLDIAMCGIIVLYFSLGTCWRQPRLRGLPLRPAQPTWSWTATRFSTEHA